MLIYMKQRSIEKQKHLIKENNKKYLTNKIKHVILINEMDKHNDNATNDFKSLLWKRDRKK